MNDITFCPGTNCPLKQRCLRYLQGMQHDDLGNYGYWWMEPAYSNCACDNYLKTENKKKEER